VNAAFDRGDRTTAFELIEENKRLNAELRQYPVEWRPMHAELRSAKEAHERAEAEFRPLQDEFVRARDEFDDADAAHQTAERDFQATTSEWARLKAARDAAKAENDKQAAMYRQAKAEAERAKEAFHARREELRRESDQRKEERNYLAQLAGVPSQYWDDLIVSVQGTIVSFYFGGMGEPDGPGHGHYVLDTSTNKVTYSRDPDERHGAHNFADYEERSRPRPRPPKGPWTPAASQPPDVGIIYGTEGGLDNMVSFKVNQEEPPHDDVLIADGDYSEDTKGFDDNHDHSWYDKQTDERGYKDHGKYTGPGGSND